MKRTTATRGGGLTVNSTYINSNQRTIFTRPPKHKPARTIRGTYKLRTYATKHQANTSFVFAPQNMVTALHYNTPLHFFTTP